MQKKTITQILVLVFLLVGLSAGYIALCMHEISKTVPPVDLENIVQFRSKVDDGTMTYWDFERDGKTYIEARTTLPDWTLPSGSVCYVFDDQGKFVDWISDNGESSAWNNKWGQTGRRKSKSHD